MKNLILFVFLLVMLSSFNQKKEINKKVSDTKTNEKILVGYCNRKGLTTDEFSIYYNIEYKDYKPDTTVIEQLKNKIDGVSITIVMGSWCGDSQIQVPCFYKIMDILNYDVKNITLICVDRKFKANNVSIDKLNIKRVPTFIFYKNKTEIGRIIETPKVSLEKDMLNILSN